MSNYKYILGLFAITFLLAVNGYSQQVKVIILDSKTGNPVPFAHVCLEAIDGSGEVHAVTDETGSIVNKSDKQSIIAISSVGYETLFDTVNPGRSYKLNLKPTVHSMDEVVVTAQYTPEKADKSIYKVQVINNREIEQKGANNLNELLNSELNIRTSQDGALGSSMSIQGLTGEHIKYLIDGVPVIGRLNGNIDISQLNLYNVDHIEIIEGPMSVVYGSNALAGVVNIVTKENKNTKFTANANTYLESVGIFNFDGGLSFKKKKHLFSLSGGRNFFNGYTLDENYRDNRWKPKRQLFLDGYYIYDNKNFKLKASSSIFNEKLLSKGNLLPPYYEIAFDTYFYTNRFTNKIEISKKFRNERYFNFMAAWSYYNRKKNTFIKDMTTLEEKPTANPEDHDTTIFNSYLFRGTYSKNNKQLRLNYQAGFDINIETGEGKRITDGYQDMGDYAAFLSIKWEPLNNFLFQPGLRFIYNTKYNAPLVYSFNLKYGFLEHYSIRGSYSRGFRAPSLKELYLYFVDVNHNIRGNEDLESENSHNLNFSFNYQRENGKFFYHGELSLFYNNINNIITLAQVVGDLYTYINVDKYITKGFLAKVDFKLYPNLSTTLGFGVTGRYNSISEEQNVDQFFYSPDVITSLNYRIVKYNMDISVFYKYNGKLQQFYVTAEDEVTEGYISDYNTMDITISKAFLSNSLRVSTGIKNVFDNTIIPAVGGDAGGVHSGGNTYPIGWGRTVFLSLSYVFNKF